MNHLAITKLDWIQQLVKHELIIVDKPAVGQTVVRTMVVDNEMLYVVMPVN